MRVAGLADAAKEDVVGERLIGALDQHEGRTLAHGDAIALGIEGPARLAGDQLQRVEAIQGGETQRIDTADDGGVNQAAGDHALRIAKHLGAGGAGGGDHVGRTVQGEVAAHEVGQRIAVVRVLVVVPGWQGAGDRITVAVGDLGAENARGAGAQKDADARAAVALHSSLHGLRKAILLQRQLGQAVVAAIKGVQIGAQLDSVELVDRSDAGVQIDSLPTLAPQPGALVAQGSQGGLQAGAQRAGHGE